VKLSFFFGGGDDSGQEQFYYSAYLESARGHAFEKWLAGATRLKVVT